MYLHNEGLEGKRPLTNNYVLPNKYSSWKQQPEIVKLRKRLLILTGVFLGLSCLGSFNFLLTLIMNSKENRSWDTIITLIFNLSGTAFYALGFYITYRCLRKSLIIFAWCAFIHLVIATTILILLIIGIVHKMKEHENTATSGIVMLVTIVVAIYVVFVIIKIFIIRYAFALSKLLKIIQSTINQRV